jgi:peptidoglycan/xylan/chitin deacetylase (PgdA/CDA1 family)
VSGVAPVLVYHRVHPAPGREAARGAVHAATFERQMRFLADGGYATLTAGEVLGLLDEGRVAPPRAVALTFDDATADHWSWVFPVLARWGIKATFFVPTGRVEEGPCRPSLADVRAGRADTAALPTDGAMRWSELAAVAHSGLVELQSHTHTHARPATPGREAPGDLQRLRDDLRESRAQLARRLGIDSRVLAWPHGIVSPGMQGQALAEGFRLTFATSTPQQVPGGRLLHRRHFGEDYDGPLREPVHYLRFVQTVESACRVGWRWRVVRGLGTVLRGGIRRASGAA